MKACEHYRNLIRQRNRDEGKVNLQKRTSIMFSRKGEGRMMKISLSTFWITSLQDLQKHLIILISAVFHTAKCFEEITARFTM